MPTLTIDGGRKFIVAKSLQSLESLESLESFTRHFGSNYAGIRNTQWRRGAIERDYKKLVEAMAAAAK